MVPELGGCVAALVLRLLLASAGWRSVLEGRPEVGTPLTALPRLREGAFLLNTLHQSPYAGSAFHGHPLLLPLLLWPSLEKDPHYVLPFAVCDALSAVLLWVAAKVLLKRCAQSQSRLGLNFSSRAGVARHLPSLAALAFLWNPFSLLACVGGSSGCVEVTAILLALCGCVLCNPMLAALGVVFSASLSPHHALLMVPAAIMIWRGPEDISLPSPDPVAPPHVDEAVCEGKEAEEVVPTEAVCEGKEAKEVCEGKEAKEGGTSQKDDGTASQVTQDGERIIRKHYGSGACSRGEEQGTDCVGSVDSGGQMRCAGAATLGGMGAYGVVLLCGMTIICSACVGCLSLLVLLPAVDCGDGGCWEVDVAGIRIALNATVISSWLKGSFGFQFIAEDLTPNFGLWWYWTTQMFDAFRPFFLFILNCQLALMSAPLAIRFANRPVLLFVLHCIVSAMMKPYPSVSDLALYMALLPLLYNTLPHLKHGLFLSTSFLSIAALEPALWHLWIRVDVANGNLFYAVTLALGATHLVLINDIVVSAIRRDRLLAGKPIYRI